MSQEQWTAVDDYFNSLLIPPDPTRDEAVQATADAGMPLINVTPNQGKLLHILALAIRAHYILEIGTLGGYSTIWLARALPADGQLITLEADPQHAAVARANLERAGVAAQVRVMVAPALESLPKLADHDQPPFDLVFIDADKPNTAAYFQWAMKLTHPGSLIITDNVVRKGNIVNAESSDVNVQGVRAFNRVLAAETRVTATVLQTVGSKGYDGFAIAVVRDAG